MSDIYHYPVLPLETADGLAIKPDGTYLDCTVGGGGHSAIIAAELTSGRLIAVDKDGDAIAAAGERLAQFGDRVELVRADFKSVIADWRADGRGELDGVLMDLGVSSHQLDDAQRGFSYMADAPLDMRMNREQSFSAYEVVNYYSEKRLSEIMWRYGEEKFSRQIAAAIAGERARKPLTTTGELAKLIESAVPARVRYRGSHPCKRVFQAIRIEVNGELDALDKAIEQAAMLLKKGGRICVISFHSLEDRIAKRTLQYLEADCVCPPSQPICTCGKRSEIKIITKKPLTAIEAELLLNPRAASAKLRVAERI